MRPILILLTISSFVSCSIEPVEPKHDGKIEVGYLKLSGKIHVNSSTGKQDVPECNDLLPVKVRFHLVNSKGDIIVRESPVTVDFSGEVTSSEDLVYPVGRYMVDEISLLDANNVITHTVPNIGDPILGINFFSENILPMEITIEPYSVTVPRIILLCNNTRDLGEITAEIESGNIGVALETDTIWIYVQEGSCVKKVLINAGEAEFGYVAVINIDEPGYYSAQFFLNDAFGGGYRIEAFDGDDNFLQVWHSVNSILVMPADCIF